MINVPYRSGERYWWSLTIDQRAHYERCVTAIVAYYARHTVTGRFDHITMSWLVGYATQQHLTDSPLVCAVLWRLQEELS